MRSIVDRFLEHSRALYFENACQPEVYVGSADWMPRNLNRRIEVVFPIEDGVLRERIIREILAVSLSDNVKARILRADNTYRKLRRKRNENPCRSQSEFIRLSESTTPHKAAKTIRPADIPLMVKKSPELDGPGA